MKGSKNIQFLFFLVIFILFSVQGMSLYPQSLFNTIYNFDVMSGERYIYYNRDKLTIICHPVDGEFFSWMLNTEGSPEQYAFLIDLYEKLFTNGDNMFPVFSLNIKNNTDVEYPIYPGSMLVNHKKVEIFRYTDYAIFDTIYKKIILNPSEEVKLFIFRNDISLNNDLALESFVVEIEGIMFSFEDNPAWDFLKHDIVKYPRY